MGQIQQTQEHSGVTEQTSPAGAVQHCVWHCQKPGILPIYNAACTETQGSRCLLGVLIVEE